MNLITRRSKATQISRRITVSLVIAIFAPLAGAQWSPGQGDWTKSHQTDVRVMTYNIYEGISSMETKTDGPTQWNALAMIVAAIQPDILIIQEGGDNSNIVPGASVDSPQVLTNVMDMFINGGVDIYNNNQPVTAYVRRYAPDFEMPYIFVSTITDNFNRNVILSRYPFKDLNATGSALRSDMHPHLPAGWAPGGNGGIRGMQFAEIDLPDHIYAGDIIVGNAHLKAFGDAASRAQRLEAAQNLSSYVQQFFYGDASNVPNPNGWVLTSNPPAIVPCRYTPVIYGGDLNEDEATNNRRGPAEWMRAGAVTGGNDGIDRDGSDGAFDNAVDVFSGNRATFGSSTKLDYLIYPDSIVGRRRAFIFNSATASANNALPPFFSQFGGPPQNISVIASDHRPVVLDAILTLAHEGDCRPGSFQLTGPVSGTLVTEPEPVFDWEAAEEAVSYSLIIATDASFNDIVFEQHNIRSTSFTLPAGVLDSCGTFVWTVDAENPSGTTGAQQGSESFVIPSPADLTGDGIVDADDFFLFLQLFAAGDPRADFNNDGVIDADDFFAFLTAFAAGCP
ncbi:MAG: hypothetical protein EA423_02025 [Phycisphaerales bacterium]|nr:MAG: hypothetical protein EA423_02025 [Phycisphaerales bacterium]